MFNSYTTKGTTYTKKILINNFINHIGKKPNRISSTVQSTSKSNEVSMRSYGKNSSTPREPRYSHQVKIIAKRIPKECDRTLSIDYCGKDLKESPYS